MVVLARWSRRLLYGALGINVAGGATRKSAGR